MIIAHGGAFASWCVYLHDGGGVAKGGRLTLYVDGARVGEGGVDSTVPMIYSGRRDLRRRLRLRHPGQRGLHQRRRVQPNAALDDNDHLITPKERFRAAMAIQ